MNTTMTDPDLKVLPVENTIWIVHKTEIIMPNGENLMVVMDKKSGCVVQTERGTGGLESRAVSVLKDAMLKPMIYKPRRPKIVLFKDIEPLKDRVLQELGLFNQDIGLVLACSVCRREGSSSLFDLCDGCAAVHYCSTECRDVDRKQRFHLHWCSKMAAFMKNAQLLAPTAFEFAQETGNEWFDNTAYKNFLERYGVYGRGFWSRELKTDEIQPKYGNLKLNENNPIVLEEGKNIGTAAALDLPTNLSDWSQYYKWRDLELSSPLAILMNLPLTVYHIVTNLIPRDYPEHGSTLEKSSLVVHLIGAEKEVDYIPLFMELGFLLPSVKVEIWMVGNKLSKKVDGKVTVQGNVSVTVKKGLYHKLALPKPHVAIGLNAGLGAYQTWSETLIQLKNSNIPAYFSDYCAYSCECTKGQMEDLKLGTISDLIINPFRSPVRKFCQEQRMAWYSNAYIYRLVYDS